MWNNTLQMETEESATSLIQEKFAHMKVWVVSLSTSWEKSVNMEKKNVKHICVSSDTRN